MSHMLCGRILTLRALEKLLLARPLKPQDLATDSCFSLRFRCADVQVLAVE